METDCTTEPLFFAQLDSFFSKSRVAKEVGAMSFFPERKARAKAIKRKYLFGSFTEKRLVKSKNKQNG
ncbi:hypothetical protein [Pseudopedobacter saltans]|uniref:hypothetical protein n=1 Tax=Pseudopedobacter saltans TaxID=151895 RepID=UPI0002E7B0F3|nr:hypothetical protein [Pseudopedobacter saltans]